jgi:hypothetical protein
MNEKSYLIEIPPAISPCMRVSESKSTRETGLCQCEMDPTPGLALIDAILARGSHGPQPARKARTRRMRHGRLTILDGPFAETKEQRGGYVVIEAGAPNERIQIAAPAITPDGTPTPIDCSFELCRWKLCFGATLSKLNPRKKVAGDAQ